MKRTLLVILCIVALTGFVMAQTYTRGSGLTGVDKLGAHNNNGRGCVGCHAPHSGSRGNGGNAGSGTTVDPDSGNSFLWGEDLGPLYGYTISTGGGSYNYTMPPLVPGVLTPEQESEREAQVANIMTCLSCHDGNIAKGGMMTGISYEKQYNLLPQGGGLGYGPNPIPTLLGNDGTGAGNYKNDHPVGTTATLGAVGVASRLTLSTCGTAPNTSPCLQPNSADTQFMNFYNHYGAFNITRSTSTYRSGGRTTGVIIPPGATDASTAYLTCNTCHTPHSMYTTSVKVENQPNPPAGTSYTYPSYFFIAAPYNPFAPTSATTASSATQFCRQCHFTGAGGSNEGSNINTVTTSY